LEAQVARVSLLLLVWRLEYARLEPPYDYECGGNFPFGGSNSSSLPIIFSWEARVNQAFLLLLVWKLKLLEHSYY
jgi:hypothetical protein